MNVSEAYSVFRSLHWGATLEALNVGIIEPVINMNNKWRKEMRANGMMVSMSMLQSYTDAEVSVPTLIKYSNMLPG